MTWLLGILLVGSALVCLEQRRRLLALQQENRQLRQGADVVAGLMQTASGQDWQGAIQGLVDQLIASGVARAATVVAMTDEGALQVLAAASAPGEETCGAVDLAPARQALISEAPVRLADGCLILPLWESGDPVGLLGIKQSDPVVPAGDVLVGIAGLLVSGLRSHMRQMALSNLDGLTGLANHRHFHQALAVAIGQAYLENEPLSILYMDIDHFKQVNDRYGHQAGDTVLREFAMLLRRELPAGALAARYGGEELVIMLQGQHSLEAEALAEHLRHTIEEHPFLDRAANGHLNITVSLGVASYQLGQGKSKFIARADHALYVSKREGRNRITVAPPEVDTREPCPT